MIRNKKTGQIYIGQSKNIENRFKKHCSIPSIDIAIANEGKDNFDFDIIEESSEDMLLERENYWIEQYNTYNNDFHYNKNNGMNSPFRRKYTLWDAVTIGYNKADMYKQNFNMNPRKCFHPRYNNKRLPMSSYDFVSCEIINRLIKEALKDENE